MAELDSDVLRDYAAGMYPTLVDRFTPGSLANPLLSAYDSLDGLIQQIDRQARMKAMEGN